MDPIDIFLPGAQALVAQILSDGWVQARGWLAKQLSRGRGRDPAAVDLERQLDMANAQASMLLVPEVGVPAGAAQRMMLEAYWTGYLAAMAEGNPDFAVALAELAGSRTPAPAVTISNSVTGAVTGNVLQAGHIDGGVHFG